MKLRLLIFFSIFIYTSPCFSKDIVIRILNETYEETERYYGSSPVLLHSLEVDTEHGPKVIILSGNDMIHRTWLREFISTSEQFVIKLPKNDLELFKRLSIYKLDARRLYPMQISQDAPSTKEVSNRLDRDAIKKKQAEEQEMAIKKEKVAAQNKLNEMERKKQEEEKQARDRKEAEERARVNRENEEKEKARWLSYNKGLQEEIKKKDALEKNRKDKAELRWTERYDELLREAERRAEEERKRFIEGNKALDPSDKEALEEIEKRWLARYKELMKELEKMR